MEQIKWFERKFDFSFTQNIFPAILERLEGTPIRIKAKMQQIPPERLLFKPDGKWSMQEHLGHLLDLEPLWQWRLADILANEPYLRSADLANEKTDFAGHNDRPLEVLLLQFQESRALTLSQLANLTEEEVYQSALHPRLEKPMRTMDLFLFVAEHDDHHLASITEINKTYFKD